LLIKPRCCHKHHYSVAVGSYIEHTEEPKGSTHAGIGAVEDGLDASPVQLPGGRARHRERHGRRRKRARCPSAICAAPPAARVGWRRDGDKQAWHRGEMIGAVGAAGPALTQDEGWSEARRHTIRNEKAVGPKRPSQVGNPGRDSTSSTVHSTNGARAHSCS
jgi:hypothetical protein